MKTAHQKQKNTALSERKKAPKKGVAKPRQNLKMMSAFADRKGTENTLLKRQSGRSRAEQSRTPLRAKIKPLQMEGKKPRKKEVAKPRANKNGLFTVRKSPEKFAPNWNKNSLKIAENRQKISRNFAT